MVDQFLDFLPIILNTIYTYLKSGDFNAKPNESLIKQIEDLENLIQEQQDELNQLKQEISFIKGHLSK